MPEWLKGTGCKPVSVSLRWFESSPTQLPAIRTELQARVFLLQVIVFTRGYITLNTIFIQRRARRFRHSVYRILHPFFSGLQDCFRCGFFHVRFCDLGVMSHGNLGAVSDPLTHSFNIAIGYLE